MIKRTCDRCEKELEAHNVISMFCSCNFDDSQKSDNKEQSILMISAKRNDGKFVMVDLCEECGQKVYDYIFHSRMFSI